MPGSLLGTSVVRVEDPDLLVGHTTFIGGLTVPGMVHLAFVRSPHAHAEVTTVDVVAALAVPGVVAAFTAADLDLAPFAGFGSPMHPACLRPPLARDRVRFVGDPVAVVAAVSPAAAADGAEAVVVDYRPRPSVSDAEAALAPGAPLQFDDVDSNMAAGSHSLAAPALDGAEVVVRARFENQRVAVVPMEGNAILVNPDGEGPDQRLTIHVSTQMPHLFQRLLAGVMGLDRAAVRVIAPHVGGGFGGKAGIGAEHLVAVAVARRLGRAVRWVETRSENMVASPHGRGQVQFVELGLKRDGTITGLRVRMVGDAGAYAGFGGGLVLGPTRAMAQGVYRIPAIDYAAAVALTNTTPVGAYRGAGRPEAAACLERVMDLAADELGLDPVEIRRRNLIGPDEFPYRTLMGTTYDTGDYGRALDEAMRIGGYEELRAEQRARRDAGAVKQLGIGVSAYVEITAGGMSNEFGSVTIDDDGGATISVGTSGHGQGHATSFAMIVSDLLGIDLARIRFVQSDTALVPRGNGTGGSRSLQIGGSAVHGAATAVLDRARQVAARLLEADEHDIVVGDDGLGVAGVPAKAVSWAELALAARRDEGEPLAAIHDAAQEGPTFPFGAHLALVEVDTETGRVELLRHVAVDDCGRILNPMIVTGQQHGGIASGVAQALFEQVVFDGDGNPLTTTLADYLIPSAADLPSFEAYNIETPTHLNVLGAKGIGESGTIGSTPAVQNAVIDAVRHLGVRHIDMPCTPERVWRAIADGRAGRTDPWREPPAVFERLTAAAAATVTDEVDI